MPDFEVAAATLNKTMDTVDENLAFFEEFFPTIGCPIVEATPQEAVNAIEAFLQQTASK
jgi:hypothetical protein